MDKWPNDMWIKGTFERTDGTTPPLHTHTQTSHGHDVTDWQGYQPYLTALSTTLLEITLLRGAFKF